MRLMARLRAGRLGRAGLQLALLGVLVFMLVPQGYMLDTGGGGMGDLRIVICTGHGPLSMADHHHTPAKPGDQAHQLMTCAWAGHSTPGLVPVAAPIVTRGTYAALAASLPADLVPGRGLAAPPPHGRAPPIIG